MKKTNAMLGTLAVASSLFASVAMADTSTTAANAVAPKLIDKLVASYWGSYSGPSITSPDARTLSDGEMTDVQNLDSTLTAGYKLTDKLTLAGNFRFVIQPLLTDKVPTAKDHYFMKDPWISIKDSKIFSYNTFNVSGDLRLYLPLSSGATDRYNTAVRLTQISTYEIPRTRITLGTYTIERANAVKESSKMENFSLLLAPFGSYQLTQAVSATVWSDVLQYDIRLGQDISNKPVDLSVGANWDVTSNFSVNPQLTVFPGSVTLDKTTIGAIISAKFL